MKFVASLLLIFSLSGNLCSQTFKSTDAKVQLLELYSSQGCSSCPPAERWVSQQLQHADLWHKFIPLVFHVDYWDYLGWKDPFSDIKFSQRQRKYFSQKTISSVYTPCFILDGQEWRGWYRNTPFTNNTNSAGTLSVTLVGNQLTAQFTNNMTSILNIALLGFGVKTAVLRGENHNKMFTEDFIVLSMQSHISNNGSWTLPFELKQDYKAHRYALAIWVNNVNSLKPLQATGGWIQSD